MLNQDSILVGLLVTGLTIWASHKYFKKPIKKRVPISVNYHFSRKCNYTCGFCFHTAKNSDILSLEQAKLGLTKLKDAGMRKINFAGGEPFLYPKFLGELVVFCKETLKLESVSIISNGSLIKESWMNRYSKYLDILGISCDSFDEKINIKIGRGKGKQIENIFKTRELCYKYNIKFKLNTVVCKYNYLEDMNEFVARLDPFRWKCFQVLIVKTENDGDKDSKRNAHDFKITDEEYEIFIKTHENQKCLIKESNSIMKSSYLILDEYMRFLDKGMDNDYIISESLLDVGVDKALSQINWDYEAFENRQGEYDWSNEFSSISCSEDKNLEW
jgi:radical S-adenosyl methionine domain-containing protein 2